MIYVAFKNLPAISESLICVRNLFSLQNIHIFKDYNQISSWSVVQDLLASLPYLKTLNLSHNPLEPTVSFDQNLVAPKLKTLILNGITPLPFTEIEKFIPTLPSLNELHLSHRPFSNDITLEEEGSPLSTVTILYITECQLSQWSDVLRIIRRFPNLTRFETIQ